MHGSFFLTFSAVTTAASGFIFWIVVARLYNPAQVGLAASLISTTSLVASFSLLGLNSTLVRFPSQTGRNAQITKAMVVVAATATVAGLLYILGLPWYAPKLAFIQNRPGLCVALVGICGLAALNLLTDSVFVGARMPQYNLVTDGLAQGAVKLIIPFTLGASGAFGILGAVGGGYVAAVLASLFLMRRVAAFRFDVRRRPTRLLGQSRFSAASYVSSILNLAPIMAIPVIVLQRLGAQSAGYYYIAFQMANLLHGISYAIAETVFAEVSHDQSRLAELLKRSALLLAATQVPAAIVLAASSGPVLRIFGGPYAAGAQELLIMLCFAALAVGLNTWASFALKLAHRLAHLIISNIIYAVVVIGLAILWTPRGLVWLGVAWCTGNLLSGLYAAVALFACGLPGQPDTTRFSSCRSAQGGSMRILVINAYVRENAGDAALLSVCLRHVGAAFPGADVVIAGMEDPLVYATFETAKNIGSIRRYVADGTIRRFWRVMRKTMGLLLATGYLLLPARACRAVLSLVPIEARREVDAASTADLVVSMGGGYLNARPGLDGYQNVFFVLLPALIAQKHGVPVVFAPQSFGPFATRSQRWLVSHVLCRAELVLAREDISVEVLMRCRVPAPHVGRAVDSGFAFCPTRPTRWRCRLGVDETTRLLGVTARAWLPPADQERYERALAATIDAVQESGTRVVLIPQVSSDYLGDDDRIVERRIASYCASVPLQVDDQVDYRELKGLYGEFEMLVGTRFHSVIFSLTSRVPCIAIEYEHKTRGIMRDLGLEEWVIPIADVTYERLWPMVQRLRTRRRDYVDVLRRRLPHYVAEADRLPGLLRGIAGPTLANGHPTRTLA